MNYIKPGDICAVEVAITGSWPAWYLARIVKCTMDDQDNWTIPRARIIAETFDRDGFLSIFHIKQPDKQEAAKRLAAKQWVITAFPTKRALQEAILAA